MGINAVKKRKGIFALGIAEAMTCENPSINE